MNALRMVCVFMGMLGLVTASNGMNSGWGIMDNSIKDHLKPTDWLPLSVLDKLPSMEKMTIKRLEDMTVHDGADWIRKMYYISQAGSAFEPAYAPLASEIPAYYISPSHKKVNFKLNEMPKIVKDNNDISAQEITIYITGLPEKSETIKRANRELIEAYMQRYAMYMKMENMPMENMAMENMAMAMGNMDMSSSKEQMVNNPKDKKKPAGTIIVIEVGKLLEDMLKYATFDVERTGQFIGDVVVQLTDKADMPHEIVHIIGSNMGAHIAGAVGREFSRATGHTLRRITGLDPTNIYAIADKALTGLARGDADFVDVIHTSAMGLGTMQRCGNADFFPNGPSDGVNGADNVVEASMRAIRYFAESVVPGNESNFPAVRSISFKEYKHKNGFGKRVHMGIDCAFDAEGDFMLETNSKSPFGRNAPAKKQMNYHDIHKPWMMFKMLNYRTTTKFPRY